MKSNFKPVITALLMLVSILALGCGEKEEKTNAKPNKDLEKEMDDFFSK